MVISVVANIPGPDKNMAEAHLLVRLFLHVVKDLLKATSIGFIPLSSFPYGYVTMKAQDPIALKKTLILVEETHPLGRLIDLDLYAIDHPHSISRSSIGLPQRSCMICDGDVYQCMRSNAHPLHELTRKVKTDVLHYLDEVINLMLEDAMMHELDLEHKFGLVTPTSKGSHPDMDYDLMLKAKDVLLPHFMNIFHAGYHAISLDGLLESSRQLGIDAERDMLRATSGINCYRGLIFILGLVLLSLGYVLHHGETLDAVFAHIKTMSRHLLLEFENKEGSIGSLMYQDYGALGARGEAHLGLPSVRHALTLFDHLELCEGNIRHVLKEIILLTDDTVLLWRSKGREQATFFKDMLRHARVQDDEVARRLTEYAISKNLSVGGSADLLVSALFLHMVRTWIL